MNSVLGVRDAVTATQSSAVKAEVLSLEHIRNTLIRQEETIIFALIERAQFKQNKKVYVGGGMELRKVKESFLDFILAEREKLDSRVGRYTSPDENAFFPAQLLQPELPVLNYPVVIQPNAINVNTKIKSLYVSDILKQLCAEGDDGQYGSAVVCDVAVLQAMSKRIHYGKFVAESKFMSQQEEVRD
jgi:chorismate mutase